MTMRVRRMIYPLTSVSPSNTHGSRYIGLNGYGDDACFNISGGASALGVPIAWDVIHYNEGLHSLWPRVNTTQELEQWGEQLGALTDHLNTSAGHPTLIYATMTPFMPEK